MPDIMIFVDIDDHQSFYHEVGVCVTGSKVQYSVDCLSEDLFILVLNVCNGNNNKKPYLISNGDFNLNYNIYYTSDQQTSLLLISGY